MYFYLPGLYHDLRDVWLDCHAYFENVEEEFPFKNVSLVFRCELHHCDLIMDTTENNYCDNELGNFCGIVEVSLY